MPTVPTYSNPQVRQQGLPNARVNTEGASLEAFGGGESTARLGQATQGLGKQAFDLVLQEKQKADEARATDAYQQTVSLKNDLFWNPQKGAMTKKGKDAFGVVDEYTTEFDKGANDIESELENEDQKALYRRMRGREKQELEGLLTKHTYQESQNYESETVKSTLATQQQDAVLNYTQPGKVQESIKMQQALIQSNGAKQGKPPELVDLEMKKAVSDTHTAIVNRMLANGQDMTAKQYYEGNKDQFDAKDITLVEKAVEEGSIRGESQRQSDQIVAKAQDMPTALANARAIEDPKLRDATTERIKDFYSSQKVAERNAVEDLHRKATDIIDKTGNVDHIPPAQWAQFSLSERASLKSYAKLRREGTEPATNWDDYYSLKTLASTGATKDQFLKINLMEYRPKMSDTEFKEMTSLQASLRKGDENADKLLDGYRTDSMIVNDALAEAGIDPTPKPGTPSSLQVNTLRKQVDDQIRLVQQQTGKKASNEEVQKIVDGLMVKGVTKKGWLFDTKKRAFELEPGERLEIQAKEIPRGEKSKIQEALRRKNLPVTDQSVLELYRRMHSTTVKPTGGDT